MYKSLEQLGDTTDFTADLVSANMWRPAFWRPASKKRGRNGFSDTARDVLLIPF